MPRVALFADSFHEVNGVALTCRQFDAYARRRQYPFLSAHAGPANLLRTEGSVTTFELARGPAAFPIERDMSFDPLFLRHYQRAVAVLRDFQPDIVHITGPSDIGILGLVSGRMLHIPVVSSWHTNLHEFGAKRLGRLLSFLPEAPRAVTERVTERGLLEICAFFYHWTRLVMAPNPELKTLLARKVHRPTFLMHRGADTILFDPVKRHRTDDAFVLGFVGRVTPEKSVRFLADLEQALIAAGFSNYRFLIVGDGSERPWLEQNLRQAEFAGVLQGEPLARAFANMDLFVFPSHTDTYGNVITEALASGVPAVVTGSGGPKFLVREGVTGFVGETGTAFIDAVKKVMGNPELHRAMCQSARESALSQSWDTVFDQVYDVYRQCLATAPRGKRAA